jgi:hypothetical protein
MKNKKTLIRILAIIVVIGLTLTACGGGSSGSNSGGNGISVTFSSLTSNGSETETTTQLTLIFSDVIEGLTANDISFSGVTGVIKGSLSNKEEVYILNINGFSTGGNLRVAVSKSGYAIKETPRTVVIYHWDNGGQSQENPGDTFGVKFDNLEGKAITLNFWEGIDSATKTYLTNRMKNVFELLDAKAGTDAAFKTKINGWLAKGIPVVIEDKDDYDIKVVGGQLHISTESFAFDSDSAIATMIINAVNSEQLAKANKKEAVRMAEAEKLFNKTERQKGFVKLASDSQKVGITI